MKEKCVECGSEKNLKRGWTNCLYCSESCEKYGVSRVHPSMPGGPVPWQGWVPNHISNEISRRWNEF